MKLLLLTVALCATAYAALPTSEYLPPLEDAAPEASNVDLQSLSLETSPLADDGYRYKTVRRLRFRHRRDVSELPSNEYLPPAQEAASAPEPQVLEAAPVVAESQDSAVLADDGYRYKTVKRYRIRRRRDVNELPSNEYLPPGEESQAVEVVEAAPAVAESQDSAVLADDGYHYRTVKRFRIRRRRDVNELPSNEYLPPAQEAASAPEPQVLEAAPVVAESQDSAVLADDGYRYKTVKRYRIRRRRDVNELPSNEYLPPAQEAASAPEPQVLEAAPVVAESQDSAVLADDGYRYKTVKRYRIRRRRDVNELPSNEYLPPAEESQAVEVVEAAPAVAESQDSAVLADDGYRYKTVKRFRIRRRRDVNELPSNEYLPPAEEAASEPAPAVVDIPAAPVSAPVAAESQDSAVLADDGYRYKTLRRVVYRRRH